MGHVLEELLCTVVSGACYGGTVVYSSEWGMFWRNCSCVHVASGSCSGGTVVYSSERGMFWRNCCVQ